MTQISPKQLFFPWGSIDIGIIYLHISKILSERENSTKQWSWTNDLSKMEKVLTEIDGSVDLYRGISISEEQFSFLCLKYSEEAQQKYGK